MVMSNTEEIRINSAEAESRYELFVGDKLVGKLVYSNEDDTRIFLHTEVDPAYQGRGLATHLIEGALDDVRDSGKHLWVRRPMVSDCLARHPERKVGWTAESLGCGILRLRSRPGHTVGRARGTFPRPERQSAGRYRPRPAGPRRSRPTTSARWRRAPKPRRSRIRRNAR